MVYKIVLQQKVLKLKQNHNFKYIFVNTLLNNYIYEKKRLKPKNTE